MGAAVGRVPVNLDFSRMGVVGRLDKEQPGDVLGGSLTSKPTWPNTPGVFGHVGFFRFKSRVCGVNERVSLMATSTTTMAQQVAKAARDFQLQRTGHAPKAVTV